MPPPALAVPLVPATHASGTCAPGPGWGGQRVLRAGTRSPTTSSAICAVLSAAPLRRLSPQTNSSSVLREVERLPHPADEGRVGADDVGRASGTRRCSGSSMTHDAGASTSTCARLGDVTRAGEGRVHGERVRGDHRHPHAGRRDLEVGHAEDLARLVADLELLATSSRRPCTRAGPRHDVEGQRRRERRVVASLSTSAGARRRRRARASRSPATTSSSSCSRSMPAWPAPGRRLVGGDDQLGERRTARAARPARRSSSGSCSWGWR